MPDPALRDYSESATMQTHSCVTIGSMSRPHHRPAVLLGVGLVFLAAACGGGTAMIATPATPTTLTLSAVRVFPALSFVQPVEMLQAPGDSSRWFVVEQGGTVRVFSNQNNVASTTTFVDISANVTCCSETGLLGMAFHPGFPATDQRAYLSYTATVNGQLKAIIDVMTIVVTRAMHSAGRTTTRGASF